MNERERSELEFLKHRQERLTQELATLSQELSALEKRLAQKPIEAAASPASKATVPAGELKVKPPSAAESTIEKMDTVAKQERPGTPQPSPGIPPVIPVVQPIAGQLSPSQQQPATAQGALQSAPGAASASAGSSAQAPPAAAPPPLPPMPPTGPVAPIPAPRAKERSFELRLGTFWLPLVGIVMLVTGLVFFGNYAYQNFIIRLNAAGKVSLLYLASFTLLGLGWWWQRKRAKESLRHYAQVLFAGGLAMVYFTTYAAHHFSHLRVITNPVLDAVLLLGWAAYMVWIADHLKSQTLALFSVLLAYYTAVITRVGQFTLYSNLVLTIAAVFFLVRNRWAVLSFVSLVASYAAYGYWRFFFGDEFHWPAVDQGLWAGAYFLIAYWIVFTAAVFLSRDEKFAGPNRASFLTVNNGAFFTMFLLTMYQVHHGGFWKFALIYGGALIALSELARRTLRGEPLASNSFLTQGLSLGTIGLITNPHLAGLNLALVLAAESVTLLLAGHQRKNLILLIGAYGCAALAVGWGMDGMLQHDPRGMWLGIGLGAVMLGNTLLVDREYRSAIRDLLRPQVSYFTVLALAIWWVATYDNVTRPQLPLTLAVEALLFIGSIYLLSIREISLFGLLYLVLAQALWGYDVLAEKQPTVWWNAAAIIVIASLASDWWQRQRVLRLEGNIGGDLRQLALFTKSLVLFGGAIVTVRMSGGWNLSRGLGLTWQNAYAPLALAALILADALMADRQTIAQRPVGIRWKVGYPACLALAGWLAVTWHHTTVESFPLVLASQALVLTLSYYLLRVPEITLFGQGYMVLAQLAWLVPAIAKTASPPWWNPLLLIAISLGLSHWWQEQKVLIVQAQLARVWQAIYAVAITAVVFYWFRPHTGDSHWLALSSALAVALTAYGVVTRAWFIAAFGQFFMLVSVAQFVFQLAQGKPVWDSALVPVAALAFFSWATVRWFRARPDANAAISSPLLQLAQIYRWVALLMSLWWVGKYIVEADQVWFTALVATVIFVWAGWQRKREALLFSAAYMVTAVALFWLPDRADRVYLPNLLALLALLAQQRFAKHFDSRYGIDPRAQGAMIIVGGLSIWLFVSDWVTQLTHALGNQGSYLTASYSGLALIFFTTGIALRERVYRWLGLGILAFCVGRVMVIDVWKFEVLYRVLSFMALGIVLLVLGFIYNKYQEKIKQWL